MLKQTLQQKLLQKLSPQQIQLMKLLQVPTMELEQRIKQEIEENPALEEGLPEEDYERDSEADLPEEDTRTESEREIDLDDYFDQDDIPDYKLYTNNRGKDDEEKGVPLSAGSSFHELVRNQIDLRPLTDKQKLLAYTLAGNLDDDGYLRRDLLSISDDLAFSQNLEASEPELLEVLEVIHDLDPAGIGARDLRECLLIQLRRKKQDDPAIRLAERIINKYFTAFSKKHYSKIQEGLDINEEALRDAIHEILRLNPKPGGSAAESVGRNQTVIPDFILHNRDGELELSLNGKNAPQLRVSHSFKNMLATYKETGKDKEAAQFVKQKLDAAKWFIDAIHQRNQTLLMTMQAIMKFQHEYFLTGDQTRMKPMILKDIAEEVGLDISTISRVTNSKYVQTDFGTFLLKSFFSESLETSTGEEVSTIEVKRILEDSIGNEDKRKPLTDEKLARLLKEKGYNIARRTVAKYREQLKIPVARMRKEL